MLSVIHPAGKPNSIHTQGNGSHSKQQHNNPHPLTTPSSSPQLPSYLSEERRREPSLQPQHLQQGSPRTPMLLSPVPIFGHSGPSADCQRRPHPFGDPSFRGHVFILPSDVPSLFFAGKSGFTRTSPWALLGAGPSAIPFLISVTVMYNSPNPSFTLQPGGSSEKENEITPLLGPRPCQLPSVQG